MKKRLREPKPLHPIVAASTGTALIKHLASCNTTVRSQSLKQLQSWLLQPQPQELSDSDLRKLWKGLFYCLWHSDKTPNQVALIDRLTSIFLSLDSSLSLDFFRGFLVTMRREWPGIDRLRLDKFYLLIRRFMKSLFELMRLKKWDVEVMREFFGVLEKDGFLAVDMQQGNGVNYHIASVFLEELKGVGFPVRKEVVDLVFEPFLAALVKSKDNIMLGKVRSCVFDELAKLGKQLLEKKKMGEECDEKDGNVLLGMVALKMGLSGKFFEAGSSVDCIQGNRKVLLGFYQEFLKLEKELVSSKIEIALPEYNYEANEEVPQLIPIDYSSIINGDVKLSLLEGSENGDQHDDEGPKKKRKKTKKAVEGDEEKLKKKKTKKGVDGDDEKVKKRTKKGVDGDDAKLKKKTKKGADGDDEKVKKKTKKGADGDDEKVKKKTKKGVDGDDKKLKKKKKGKADNTVPETDSAIDANGSILSDNDMDSSLAEVTLSNDLESLGNDVVLNEAVISNLQKQFEMVAAENGLSDDDSDFNVPLIVKPSAREHKRKRGKRAESKQSGILDSNGAGEDGHGISAKSVDKSAKKVRFSMKNNLFWKPQTPLPPESLRLPPSVVPRGSALKKGVPPGPVIDTPLFKKNSSQKKKALKRMRSATPMIRRKRKTLTGSA